MINSNDVVRAIATPLIDELLAVRETLISHCKNAQRKGLSLDNSTCYEDCLLLYSLIRRFDRKHAFEVGTYIGTTAIAMNTAARKNGGVFTTCDPVNFNALPPWDGIRFINAGSSIALRMLHEEARLIDFVFLDWVPDDASVDLMLKTCTDDTIIAIHDYVPSDPKGAQAVAAINSSAFGQRNGNWFVPDEKPCDIGSSLAINAGTAFFIPVHLMNRPDTVSVVASALR